MRKFGLVAFLLVVVLGLAGFGAFRLSPWPSVLIVRNAFATDADARNAALAKHRPEGVRTIEDLPYPGGPGFDLHLPPPGPGPAPLVFWIHGGAFIGGDRKDLAGYLAVLAGKGYAAAAPGYTLAPSARYPEPVLQANAALAAVLADAARHGVDPERIVIAGDSAGAQIAAELAASLVDPLRASAIGLRPAADPDALRGVVLFCGVYEPAALDLTGDFGGFLRTVLWSYFGDPDPGADPRFATFAVNRNVPPGFPPAFVSAGNGDPLEPQSRLLADALADAGVITETLFFPADHAPSLPHEYQFDLDGDDGRLALDRLTAFLAARAP